MMTKSKNSSLAPPPLTPEEASRMSEIFDNAIKGFSGQFDELESAMGMYVIGRHVGWKTLYLIHSKRTVAKYEKILGINLRDEFPEVGPAADRSVAFSIAKTFSNFWKVVSGEEKVERTNWREIHK